MLAQYAIDDIAVEDPPLEEVIAEVFSQVNETNEDSDSPASET